MTDFKENAQFRNSKDLWTKLKDLYEGDPQVLRSIQYLIPHEIEEFDNERAKKLRSIREARSTYTNYVSPFVHRFISLIFKKPIDYSNALTKVFGGDESELNDIDGFGNSLESFIKNQIAVHYFLYGKAAIYVDSYPSTAQTKLEEQDEGLRPFFEMWEPLSIIDWKYSEANRELNGLDFAVRRYKFIKPRSTAKDEEKIVNAYRHIYLDPASGYYQIEQWFDNEVSETVQPEPAVPFLPLAVIESVSALKEGVDKAKQLYNLESTLDNILLFQAHQRLFAIGNFADAGGSFAASEGNLVVLRGDGSISAIEPVNTASLESRIAQIKSSMFQLVFHQTRQVAADSKAVESAETIKESKDDFRAKAQTSAQDLQKVINNALWMYGVFSGNQNLEPDEFVTIDATIEEDDINEFALWMNTFGDRIRRYPAWQKQVDKKAAMLMNLPDSEAVLAEIEAGITEPDPIRDLLNANTETDTDRDNEQDQNQGIEN